MNLFSVFDPNALLNLPWNWVSSLTLLLIFPSKFWGSPASMIILLKSTTKIIFSEFKILLSNYPRPALSFLSTTLFLFIAANNILGLIPYIFTASSHLVMTLSLALPCWVGISLFAWFKNPHNTFAHLVPNGSPLALGPLMVLIELTSNIIRPITLSVRLAANMVAGHLLMTLVSSPLALTTSFSVTLMIFSGLILLTILESAVALIQSYVFSVLSCLYLGEVNSPALV